MTVAAGSVEPRSFVVLGSHRAGTSVITRALQLIGVDLGEEEQLLGPIQHDNAKGFNEHRALMRTSDELLARMGGTWRDPPPLPARWELDPALDDLRERSRVLIARDFGGRAAWAFKDPRLSLTLPFWRTVVTPTGHVIAHRSPLDVARSLERRNGIALGHGVALWAHYTASAIVNTTGAPRFIAGYAELFASRRAVISELAAFLALPDPAADPQRSATIEESIDRELRHHAGSPGELAAHPAMFSEARRLFELLEHAVQSRAVGPAEPPDPDPAADRAGRGPDFAGPDFALDAVAAEIVELGPPRMSSPAPLARRGRFGPRPLRVVAMLQVFNERRFLAGCIEHLREQGVQTYVIDNESTDETLEVAQRYLGHGVIGIETLPRADCFALRVQCERQEVLAGTLDADWLIHHDADEIRVSSRLGQTLAEAIAEFDAAGFNAVNFLEFAFLPTREFPDHDHPGFARTMRWYYPFLPRFPHRCNAWKRQDGPVDLTTDAGHLVSFPGLRMAPSSLYMRHYLFISREHAIEKFVQRRFAEDEVADGWFGWRARLRAELIRLPSVGELRPYVADHRLDPSEPLARHLLDEPVPAAVATPS